MKLFNKLGIVSVLALTLVACGAPTIDASNEKTMQESMEEVTKDMTAEEKAEFMVAFTAVTLKIGLSNMSAPEKADTALMDALDGKTAEEIIEMSKK